MRLRKITLTPEQQEFVKQNYQTMYAGDMGRELGISQQKVSENMRKMGLKTPFKTNLNPHKPMASIWDEIYLNGMFDERVYNKIYSF